MKIETERIQNLLKRNWHGPMWHGATLKEILAEISWEKVFHKPANFAHNIYEYVNHMICWRKFALEHLKGNTDYKVELNSEIDWLTKYENTEISWLKALNELESNQKELLNVMATFPESKLDEPLPGKKFSWYVLLHGIVHHDIYHSAQISILKK